MKRKIIIIPIAIIALFTLVGGGIALNGYFGGGGDISSDATTRGWVGYWNFEEGTGTTAADSTDQGNDGTLTGGPTWVSGKAGNGAALDFDGTDDFVDIGTGPSTVNTVAFWVNPTTTTEYPVDLNGTEYVWINSGTVTAQGFTSPTIYVNGVVSSTVSAGSWQHVVVTTGTSLNASVLDIGRVEGTGNHEGKADEVRIYNRALSAAEIKMLYNHGGPVIHLKMDEGTGSTAYDASGSGNDGGITGATYTTGQFGTALDFDGSGDMVSVVSPAGSATTTTFFAGVGDGIVSIFGEATWDGAHDATDGDNADYTGTVTRVSIFKALTGEFEIRRTFFPFDTSSLPDTDVISSATFSAWATTVSAVGDNDGLDYIVPVGPTSQASNTELVVGDFDQAGAVDNPTQLSDDQKDISTDFSAGSYANWTANASGLSAVDKTGFTLVGLREGHDIEDNQYEGGNNTSNQVRFSTSEETSTTQDPMLEVTHAPSLSGWDTVTASLWVNPETSIATKALMVKDNEVRLVTDASGNPECQIHNGTDWQTAATSGTALSLGSWQHVVCTYDGSDLRVYINGVETASQALASIDIQGTGDPFELGNDASGTYGDYEGIMDDFRYYTYARTEGEIRLDHNAGFAARFGGSPNQDVTRDLVGYWNFEEGAGQTVSARTDQGNDGTLGDDTTVETDDPAWTAVGAGLPANAFGVGGSALDFTTADIDEVKVPDSTSLNIIGSAITLSMWLNGDDMSTGGRVLTKGLYELRSLSGTTARLFLSTSTGSTNHDVTFAWANNIWYHFVGVYDGAEMTVFINGTEIGTPTSKTGNISSTAGTILQIGNGITSPFDGRIDDVRIYNRALSDAEIRYLYNKGGPVAHYKMDEGSGSTAFDASNITGDGTVTGATYVTGQFGTALDFDGTDDSVDIPDSASLDISGDMSISMWINPEATQAVNVNPLRKGNNYAIEMNGTVDSNTYFFGWEVSGGSNTCYTDGFTLAADVWQHVAIVKSGAVRTVYINGVQDTGATCTGGGATASTDDEILELGDFDSLANREWAGTLDDVRIYSYARSEEEIRADYNAGFAAKFGGSPNQDVTRDLVAYWNFEEGSGQTAADSSDEGNNGTLGASSAVGSDDPSWRAGKAGLGTALEFDGSTQFVEITGSDAGVLNFAEDSFYTVSAWVNVGSLPGTNQPIVSKGENQYRLGVNGSDKFEFFEKQANGNWETVSSQNSAVVGEWTHVTGVRDGTSERLYVNE